MRAGSSARDIQSAQTGKSVDENWFFTCDICRGPYVPLLHFLRQFEAPISRLIMETSKHRNEFIEYFINIMSNQGVEWRSARTAEKSVQKSFWKLSTRAMLLNPVKINKRGKQAFSFFLFPFLWPTGRCFYCSLFSVLIYLSQSVHTRLIHSTRTVKRRAIELCWRTGALRSEKRLFTARERLISRKEAA